MGKLLAAVYDPFMKRTEDAGLRTWRTDLLAAATGRVLEIGAGTGVNLPLYPEAVDEIVACEPDDAMRARLHRARDEYAGPSTAAVTISDAQAESLPFEDESFDTVVATLVLCSVEDPRAAAAEVRRVLRPDGRFLFLEHVAAEGHPARLRWQRRVEPVWKHVAGNCHLTRDSLAIIEAAGFELEEFTRASMRRALPIVRPTVRGIARRG